MKTIVYYGQYSLKHWINLMLKGNIALPEYQRSFVWDRDDIKRLIESFQKGQFVQPITIAQVAVENGKTINIILDGQQRLTSILLYYLERFPKEGKFQEVISSEESDTKESNKRKNKKTRIEWRFDKLLREDKDDNDYEEFKIEPKGNDKDDFLNNHFLGFSYIIPDCNNRNDCNSYYSTLFRKINYYGKALTDLECRTSLYYMDSEIKNYFEGKTEDNKNILCDIKTPGKTTNIDIIRYLSNLSLYSVSKDNEFNFNKEEDFYTDYVFHVLEQETEQDFSKFDFKKTLKDKWKTSYDKIHDFIETYSKNFEINPATASWYEIDFWLSGLIYCNLFNDKTINPYKDNKNLFDDIKAEFERYKNLKIAIENYEKTNLMEELEEIYNKKEFKILKDIYKKELNNPTSNIHNLFSQRKELNTKLSKLNYEKEECIKNLQKAKESEETDTIEKANKLIEEINNKKQNNKISIEDVSKSILYITKLMQLKQKRKELQDNIKKLKIDTIQESNLNSEIRRLNYRINSYILFVARKERDYTYSEEYRFKESIEIYSRYVQE